MALRVVCYLNQFFGQLGGEEKAGVGPQVADGAVGAARAVQQALGDAGTVVATVICGDNYAAEQAERAVAEMVPLVAAARPDLVVAGPAFLAGRYGVACGALCAAVQAQLEVPVVTGMHAENPGVELYRRQVHVVQTGAEATRMLDDVKRLVALGLKLARREAIGAPVAEGYFARGLTRNVVADAAQYDNPHRGYDTTWVKQDPHRLVPVDVARELERSGAIGKLHETVYSTVGVATTLAHSARMGAEIAEKLRAAGVDAVILTST